LEDDPFALINWSAHLQESIVAHRFPLVQPPLGSGA
jgi:hypothetical protein